MSTKTKIVDYLSGMAGNNNNIVGAR